MRIVISGCSGGGKSTLLAELARRGHAVVEESGRRVVREELANGGSALPWIDLASFARRALDIAAADFAEAAGSRPTFFDRGMVDAASALEHATGEPVLAALDRPELRYGRTVFLAPPWPEIFEGDEERRHDFGAAVAEYERLRRAYGTLGYEPCVLPKTDVARRADLIVETLRLA